MRIWTRVSPALVQHVSHYTTLAINSGVAQELQDTKTLYNSLNSKIRVLFSPVCCGALHTYSARPDDPQKAHLTTSSLKKVCGPSSPEKSHSWIKVMVKSTSAFFIHPKEACQFVSNATNTQTWDMWKFHFHPNWRNVKQSSLSLKGWFKICLSPIQLSFSPISQVLYTHKLNWKDLWRIF